MKMNTSSAKARTPGLSSRMYGASMADRSCCCVLFCCFLLCVLVVLLSKPLVQLLYLHSKSLVSAFVFSSLQPASYNMVQLDGWRNSCFTERTLSLLATSFEPTQRPVCSSHAVSCKMKHNLRRIVLHIISLTRLMM